MRLLSLFCVLLCFSATAQYKVPADIVAPEDAAFNAMYANRPIPKVTGKLLNISAGELKNLQISYTLITPFASLPAKINISVKPDGSFNIPLTYAFPYQQILLNVGELFNDHIYANKDLYIELDMKKIKAAQGGNVIGNGVRYLGTDGRLNIYLANYELYKSEEKDKLKEKIAMLEYNDTAPIDSILNSYKNLYDSLKKIEKNYTEANPSEYAWILENERTSDYYKNLCYKYEAKKINDSLWQEINKHKGYLISFSSTQFYQALSHYIWSIHSNDAPVTWKDVAALTDLNKEEKALIDSLQESEKKQPAYPCTAQDVQKWIKGLTSSITRVRWSHNLYKKIKAVDSLFNTAKADYLKLSLSISTDLSDKKDDWKLVLNNMHTSWCIDVAKKQYSSINNQINAINKTLSQQTAISTYKINFGKPIIETGFGAALYKAPSMSAPDFVAKLKQNFPGKAIIIDRWATWCIPCMAEMPHSKKLQIESKNIDVVFVYLGSLKSSSEIKWKTKVIELQQPGVHFLIDEALDEDISKYFSFSGYPGYALINKAGNFKPGAFTWINEIADAKALEAIINK